MSKKRIANYVFSPGVSSNSNAYPDAYSLLSANKLFIQEESSAWIAEQIILDTANNLYPNAVALLTANKTFILDEISAWTTAQVASAVVGNVFFGYVYGATEIAKCKRDMGYLIDALIYDTRYGGNEKVNFVASQYFISGVTQIINTPVELALQIKLWNLISGFILLNIPYDPSSQSPVTSTQTITGDNAEAGALTAINSKSLTISNVISGGLSTLPTTVYSVYNFPGYTYDGPKCKRDIGYVIDSYLHDLRYGGNKETRLISSRYWDGDVPQVDGDRTPEIATHTFIGSLINDYIFPQAPYTALQTVQPIVRNPSAVFEPGATTRISALSTLVVTVIRDGLLNLPAIVGGVSEIKIQGQYATDKLLLITNTTNNQIIFNFSDPQLGASVSFNAPYNSNGNSRDEDFPAFLQTTDSVTTLMLVADTSTCATTDDIQIFVEAEEQKTRPYDFGTDAIERMRVAQPQSMLDADFEYGLQPTKWQAIGIARGYPSVYEVPGSDTPVVSVVTDASAGTGGIGESTITVTTQGAHGFIAGTPITIRSLANTISGFSRAEGTFIVISAPTTTTFTYYATAKVGTTNGQVLATTYTQLRKGAFYTGAAIGQPALSVFTNGISGSFTTKFITQSGASEIAIAGSLPIIGAPLSGTGITSGTQVSGTIGPGGLALTASVNTPIEIGDTFVEVSSAVGILEGLAVNNGTGTAMFVSSIDGTTINFTQPFTAAKGGATQSYTNKTGTNVTPSGSGALFNIDRFSGAYDNLTVSDPGQDYVLNSRIKLLGSDLEGTDGVNDAVIKITGITNLDTFNIVGSSSTVGAGAEFDVTLSPDSSYLVSIHTAGDDYTPADEITILGSLVGGIDVTNDITLTVSTVTKSYLGISQGESTGPGIGATFNVSRTGSTYTVSLSSGGSDQTPGDVITIYGTDLGGVSPDNDITLTVDEVDVLNAITLFSGVTGTATGTGGVATISEPVGIANYIGGLIDTVELISGFSVTGERSYPDIIQDSTTGSGSGAVFNVSTSGGIYDVVITNPGSTYSFGEEIVILGTQVGGLSPTHDITLTVTGASAFGGGIISVNTAGLPSSVDASFTLLDGVKITPGTGASFDISRSAGAYSVAGINLPGSNYETNDQIVLAGANFDGVNPDNNVTLIVTGAVNGAIISATASGTAVLGSAIEFYSAIALSDVTTASIPESTVLSTSAIASIQAVFPSPHGLVPGASLLVDITSSGTNHALAKGPFYVESVPNTNTIRYTARTTGNIDTGVSLGGIIYARPDSYFIHRPYDGGVQLGTGGPQHGAQAIRMSKKYIRYQSGKGIMYTTGALFAPSYNLQELTADGTSVGSYITVSTDDVDHGCQVGGRIRIIGVDTAGYNGEYTIVDVITERQFRVQAQTTLANVYGSISTAAQMSILNWHGATVRAGTYDDQNGMFWQYDGRELAVGRRSSTLQLSGVASIARDNNILTGINTRFRDQVKAGDRIVIKGMTHVVSGVLSQTSMTVTPDYRGAASATQAKICLVQDLIIKQSDFNLDRLDGTGPSGYNLDISKMQMIGMQWSWYGAGFIDFMLRGADGNYVFAHRVRNSNTNTEAYMRTGNMPVRYEVINEGAIGKLRVSANATQTTLQLVDASAFPNESGTVYVDNELITFSGKMGNTLIGCSRSSPLVNFVGGAQRTFRAGAASTHELNTGVILISNTISPIISHWGSAMLTDGLFDEDRGYLFNYASTGIQASTTKQTAFLIRLAPSVSNAIIGDLGERELINRAQLLLKSISVTSDTGTGGLVIEGVLNPQNYPIDPTAISWSGLAGSSAGGQPSFAQIAPGGSVSWAGGASTQTSTATTTAELSGTATVPNNALFASALGSNVLYVTKTSWDTLGAAAGFSISASETKFPAGTTISSVAANPSPVATTLATITGSASIPASTAFKTPAGVNFLYIRQASFAALGGISAGQGVLSTDFPLGTTVTGITGPAVSAGNTYYTVSFSANSLVPHNPVTSTLQTRAVQANGNVAIITFQNTQTFAPYSIGDSITVSGNFATQFNGTFIVTACSTTQVRYTLITANYGPFSMTGSVVNNNSLSTVTLFVTGLANVGTTTMNFTQSTWVGLPIGTAVVGNTVNDLAKFSGGTQIAAISALKTFNGVNYYTVTFNTPLLASQAAGTAVTFDFTAYYRLLLSKNSTTAIVANATVEFTPAVISTNTAFLYFTKASWNTLVSTFGATTGTEIVDVLKFPSGTKVSSIGALSSFGGTEYYRVNFTQSSIAAIIAGDEITFQFGLPPYAQPGETIFSFIAAPGSAQTLELGELKELTNTTLGGRGTYPNGPDVLAINVYRASGTGNISTNIVVRWGEAQA